MDEYKINRDSYRSILQKKFIDNFLTFLYEQYQLENSPIYQTSKFKYEWELYEIFLSKIKHKISSQIVDQNKACINTNIQYYPDVFIKPSIFPYYLSGIYQIQYFKEIYDNWQQFFNRYNPTLVARISQILQHNGLAIDDLNENNINQFINFIST